jgi:AdoMet-dependent rRNA methyltransferase SPB1
VSLCSFLPFLSSAINARPIRKIAEAKARKQVKTQRRWEKIKAQAEVIANAEGGAQGDKLRQIEKLYHQKSLKKEKKERVYVVTQKNGKTNMPKSSSGRKGKIVKVDTRMKKDKRGEKKAAQRNKKAKANKNKKQRKV